MTGRPEFPQHVALDRVANFADSFNKEWLEAECKRIAALPAKEEPRKPCERDALNTVAERYPGLWQGSAFLYGELRKLLPVLDQDLRGLRGYRLPDGWRLNSEERELIWFEVENTNPLTYRKLLHIAWLWGLLDAEEWRLRLILVDATGQIEHEVDLSLFWQATLALGEVDFVQS